MFALPACMRSLIKPEPGKVLAYIDLSQQEFFVAAVRSDDQNMKDAYHSGDPYLAFAKQADSAPPEATKTSHREIRNLFKTCVLGVQYGLGAESLALKINKSTPYARELLSHHKRVYKKYWAWADSEWTKHAYSKLLRLVSNGGWL
jgi:DNA polymerase I-like protein with 3'-5' exonuclease and polymerase domains